MCNFCHWDTVQTDWFVVYHKKQLQYDGRLGVLELATMNTSLLYKYRNIEGTWKHLLSKNIFTTRFSHKLVLVMDNLIFTKSHGIIHIF
jgi:ribonucleotide reductase alpha subunit